MKIDSIVWSDLSVLHKPTGNHLISKLNGSVSKGQFLAVMGPSGSGKSTFLESLTDRFNSSPELTASGQKLINNQVYGVSEFRKYGVLVRQQDLLFETLTVYESIRFQADLKLSTEHQKTSKVDAIIKKLGLQECKNSRIGGDFTNKCISGGQKRRTSIAMELVSDPQIIILDEPTSGLDSVNALKIVKILKQLASEQKIVIATIHQPSSNIFHEFDKLMVINVGQLIYFNQAKSIIVYLQRLGIEINYKMNPADFFMFELSSYKAKKYKSVTPFNHQNYLQYNSHSSIFKNDDPIDPQKQNIQSLNKFQADFTTQLKYLFKRAAMNWTRTRINVFGKLSNIILISLFSSSLFWQVGNHQPIQPAKFKDNQTYLSEFSSAIFIVMFSAFGMNLYHMVLVFPQEKQIFYRETSNGLYNTIPYFLSRYLIQLPAIILAPLIISSIVYNTLGLQRDWHTFLIFFITYILAAINGSNLGLVLGTMFESQRIAVALLPVIMMPILIFGGLLVNLDTLPGYIRWIQYVSPLRYGANIILNSQLEKHNPFLFNDFGPALPLDWRSLLGLSDSTNDNIVYLLLLGIGFLLIAVTFLAFNKKKL